MAGNRAAWEKAERPSRLPYKVFCGNLKMPCGQSAAERVSKRNRMLFLPRSAPAMFPTHQSIHSSVAENTTFNTKAVLWAVNGRNST